MTSRDQAIGEVAGSLWARSASSGSGDRMDQTPRPSRVSAMRLRCGIHRAIRPLLAAVLLGAAAVVGITDVAPAATNGKLVLVLDSSGSMKEQVGGASKIAIAKKALDKVVDRLPADAPVGLRVYGATVFKHSDPGACTDSQLVVPISTGNRDALHHQIAKYRPYGETPISYSLKQAAQDLGGSGKRTVLLVSDGEETCDVDPCVTAANLAKQGIDLKFDVIGLRVSGEARRQLTCIAERGNGTYYDADNEQQIEDTLDKLATRAFRPFRLTGMPIEGSTMKADAPRAAPGQYVDQFPAGDTKLYYRLSRTAPNSTLHVGLTAQAAGFVPTVSMRIRTTDGDECDWGIGQVINIAGTKNVVTLQTSSWRTTPDSPCNTDPELLVELNQSGGDLDGQRFELLVREEPPVVSTRHLDPAEPTIRWQKMKPASQRTRPPVPGTSISDSPTLVPGTYTGSILTGEKQVYAVDLDWGQRLQVQVVVPPRRGALARALSVSDSLDLQLLATMRGEYRGVSVDGLPDDTVTMLDDNASYRKSAATPAIRFLNRSASGPARYAGIPGSQYIVVSKSRVRGEKHFLVPYTLIVAVVGTAGEGAPEYATSTSPSPTVTPSPNASTSASPAAPPAPPRPGLSPGAVIGVAGSALVLGAAAASGIFLLRRRRVSANLTRE
jgi:Ca-activated chloride channel family protein